MHLMRMLAVAMFAGAVMTGVTADGKSESADPRFHDLRGTTRFIDIAEK